MSDKKNGNKSGTTLDVSAALHGIGIGLLLRCDAYLNSDPRHALVDIKDLGDELWLYAEVIGACLVQRQAELKKLSVVLPSTVGVVAIENPLFEGESGTDPSEEGHDPTIPGDDFPF